MNYRAWGIPAVLSTGIPGNALRAFPGLSRIFPEFLPERPSRTGGMAHKSHEQDVKRSHIKDREYKMIVCTYTNVDAMRLAQANQAPLSQTVSSIPLSYPVSSVRVELLPAVLLLLKNLFSQIYRYRYRLEIRTN